MLTKIGSYRWNHSPEDQNIGLTAQDVAEAFESESAAALEWGILFKQGDAHPMGLRYDRLILLLLASLAQQVSELSPLLFRLERPKNPRHDRHR